MSPKQKAWAVEYIKTGNGTEAARRAYPGITPMTANIVGSKNTHNPKIKKYMDEMLDKAGMTEAKIADSLHIITDAGMSKSALRKSTPKDALRALEMAARLKDLYPIERKQVDQRNLNLRMDLGSKSQDELVEMLKKLMDEARTFSDLVKKSELDKQRRIEIGDDAFYAELSNGSKQSQQVA